jgi:hypothetical protein
MILTDFLRALGRRWYVLAVGIVATVGLAIGAYTISPPVYTARGLIILLPSDVSADGRNPFLALSDLDLPARILVSYFQSESAQNDVAAVAPDAKYVVSIEESTRGPIIAVDVKDSTPESALSTLAYIANAVPTNLTRLQTEVGAPATTFVRTSVLTMDQLAQEDVSGTIRVVVAAAAAGLVVSLIATFLVDRMLLGSGRRRGIGQQPVDDEDDRDPDDEDDETAGGIEHLIPDVLDTSVEEGVDESPYATQDAPAGMAARRAKR